MSALEGLHKGAQSRPGVGWWAEAGGSGCQVSVAHEHEARLVAERSLSEANAAALPASAAAELNIKVTFRLPWTEALERALGSHNCVSFSECEGLQTGASSWPYAEGFVIHLTENPIYSSARGDGAGVIDDPFHNPICYRPDCQSAAVLRMCSRVA